MKLVNSFGDYIGSKWHIQAKHKWHVVCESMAKRRTSTRLSKVHVVKLKSLVFICRENPRRSGISLFPDRPRFADISNIRLRFVPDFPDYEFGGTSKACETLKLEHKCNSISVTWMHTSLCCVVLNTSVFLHSSMQGFPL